MLQEYIEATKKRLLIFIARLALDKKFYSEIDFIKIFTSETINRSSSQAVIYNMVGGGHVFAV